MSFIIAHDGLEAEFGLAPGQTRYLRLCDEHGTIVTIDGDRVAVREHWERSIASTVAVRLINARREMVGFCVQRGATVPVLQVDDVATILRHIGMPGLSACINRAFRRDT
jgi:hypothetical protein